jgi:hypothetical protein
VHVEIMEVGRRFVPSVRVRAEAVDRKRGVNDPGAARPVRPRPLLVGVVHAPPVSMSDEARLQSSSSGGSTGKPASV